MAEIHKHLKNHPGPDPNPTDLPEPKDRVLWSRAQKKARAFYKGKKAPKHAIDVWAQDWYSQQGGLFKDVGSGGMESETEGVAKVRNKEKKKDVEDAKASIMLLPIFAKKLTTKERNALPAEYFVFPNEKSYPIHDKNHAINALARATQSGDPKIVSAVKRAVYKKYPELKKSNKTKASYANALGNLQVLANVVNMLATENTIIATTKPQYLELIVGGKKLKLDKDAFYQPQKTFKNITSKLVKTISASPEDDFEATSNAQIQKLQAEIQTIKDKIAKHKAKMDKVAI